MGRSVGWFNIARIALELIAVSVTNTTPNVDLTCGIAEFCINLDFFELLIEPSAERLPVLELFKRIGPQLKALRLPEFAFWGNYKMHEIVQLWSRATDDVYVDFYDCEMPETLCASFLKLTTTACRTSTEFWNAFDDAGNR